MNRIKRLPKAGKFFAFLFVILEIILLLMPAYAWGPIRDVYTYQEINELQAAGKWDNKITFNSITNSPPGDERSFVSARENNGINKGNENIWSGSDITAEDGKEYYIRLFVHNNNPNGWSGVAENVRTFFNIPTISAKTIQINGFIHTDNADPKDYWDYVNFNSDHAFHLEYQYGSAILLNNAIGKSDDGYPLSDEVVTKSGGTLIGYDKLDGRIPGCYEYACYVLIRVKVVFDSDFTVDASVRQANSPTRKEEADVKVGDKIDIQLQYKNTSNFTQNDVAARVVLPDGLRFVEGSGRLINSSHPEGAPLEGDYIVSNGVVIGNYEPNASAQIILTAEVTKDSLSEISNTLRSYVQIGINSFVMQDSVGITVKSSSTTPYIIDALIAIVLLGLILALIRKMRKKF